MRRRNDQHPPLPAETPRIGADQIALLEKLSNACAVSGDEQQVRKIVLEEIRPIADELRVDALGNVLAVKESENRKPAAGDARCAHG